MIVLIWAIVLSAALVLYLRDVYAKLGKAQLNHLPTLPVFGNMLYVTFKKEHVIQVLDRGYKAFPEDRIVGHYEYMNPVLIARDPELLKSITVKDFEYFVDRRAFGEINDPIFSRNLLLLKGNEWKSMRSSLSPAFTSSKIRLMAPLMAEVGDQMTKALKTKIDNANGCIDIDVKDLTTRYTTDVIATCAFGLKVNSQTSDNHFYVMARKLATVDFKRVVKFFGFRSFPGLMKKLQIYLVPVPVANFFKDVILGTIKQREKNNIVRHDMINLLMDINKGKLEHDHNVDNSSVGFATTEEASLDTKHKHMEWTDDELVSQAAVFLVAGVETVATITSFLLHEMALNPEIQERLVQEIRDSGETLDFNAIQSMVYLDMVVSETLRLWSATPLIDRQCVKDYNAGRPNSDATKDLIIRKGEVVTIPLWSIHHDPQHYPEPYKFDPERFSEQNRHNIIPYTYMPFGLGPRSCIGSRFALCEVKMLTCQILQKFEVSPCAKTCVPSELHPGGLAVKLRGGHWLRFKLRN